MQRSICLVFCAFLTQIKCEYVVVDTLNGPVMGIQQKTDPKENTFYAFKGIPYAEPPNRFELSVPVNNWGGTYNATYDHAICMQIIPTFRNESENCLFLNIYTPKLPKITNMTPPNSNTPSPKDYDDYYDHFTDDSDTKINVEESSFVGGNYTNRNVDEQIEEYDEDEVDVNEESGRSKEFKKMAVMVWVHGGAFTSGDSSYETYGPDYFLDDGVVFASMNYRLGTFGFLSTGDSRLPANLGLKDIVVALQWIKSNIENFGGDPERITIFGESAGAVAISQSGTSLAPWAIQRDPKKLYNAMVVASGCIFWVIGGPSKIHQCLKTTDANILRFASTAVFGVKAGFQVDIMNSMSFSLAMEEPSETAAVVKGSYEFLTKDELPNIPILMGTNSEESIALNSFLGFIKPFFLQIDINPTLLVPLDMNAPKNIIKRFIAPKLFDYYYNKKTVTRSSDENTLRFVSGNFFNRAFREYLTLLADKVTTYCYKFSYEGKMGGIHTFFDGLERVGHADELNYLFRNNVSRQLEYPEQDFITRHRLVRMWTNFAKAGNPTPVSDDLLGKIKWPKAFINGTNIRCLNIRNELHIIKNPFQDEYMMWKELYDKFGKPSDTY